MTLPPPVTKNSSNKDLWEEILALRDEIDAQKTYVNEARTTIDKQAHHIVAIEYQLRCIRQVLSLEIKP